MHSDDGADAAADDGKNEKRGFRNAPSAFARLEFIDSHDGKAYKIDNG